MVNSKVLLLHATCTRYNYYIVYCNGDEMGSASFKIKRYWPQRCPPQRPQPRTMSLYVGKGRQLHMHIIMQHGPQKGVRSLQVMYH